MGAGMGGDRRQHRWHRRSAATLAASEPNLRVLCLPVNVAKARRCCTDCRQRRPAATRHVLTMDADGQHPAGDIREFMAASQRAPQADDARRAAVRRQRTRIARAVAGASRTGGPIWRRWAPACRIRCSVSASIRSPPCSASCNRTAGCVASTSTRKPRCGSCWAGVPPLNLPAPVRYLSPSEGGVSHFDYLRDNVLLTGMHIRLMIEFVFRLPWLLRRRPALAVRSRMKTTTPAGDVVHAPHQPLTDYYADESERAGFVRGHVRPHGRNL